MFSKFHHLSPPHPRRPSAQEPADTQSLSHTLHCRPNAVTLLPPAPPPPNDGATIEVARRPRGRPPGSKNKPKQPVVITRDPPEPTMSPYVLELPAGVDIVESTTRFSRRRCIGLCVLSGNGVVTNVTLRQPSSTPGATVTFHGQFDILSISATILPAGSLPTAGDGMFTLSLAGPQGQVVGGLVVGPLVAAGTIYLVAATFNNPSFHRLQETDHDQDTATAINGDGGRDFQKAAVSVGVGAAAETTGGLYSYQPADVIWAPTARQPPPPPY